MKVTHDDSEESEAIKAVFAIALRHGIRNVYQADTDAVQLAIDNSIEAFRKSLPVQMKASDSPELQSR